MPHNSQINAINVIQEKNIMKIIMPIINGMTLSYIAISQGHQITDWQWWAWVVGGAIYVMSYNKLKNSKIIFN